MFVRSPDSVYTACTSTPGWSSAHEEHREAPVLGHVRVGAGQEEHVVGDVGVRREHLLAVDDPPVAVAPGAGARRRRRRSPTSGSVMPRAIVISPRRKPGRTASFSSSVPTARMTLATISVVLIR